MKILFLGTFYDKKTETELLHDSRVGVPNACNILQWNLIKGLETNLKVNIAKVTSKPLGNFPIKSRKLFVGPLVYKTKKKYCEMGYINFFIVKHFFKYRISYYILKKWLSHYCGSATIIVYDIYLPYLKSVYKLKKHFPNLVVCVIVTDLPGEYGAQVVNGRIFKFLLRYRVDKQLELLKTMDYFVLTTNQMASVLKILPTQYCVIEGIINTPNLKEKLNGNYTDKRIIMYAGSLEIEYGIKNLLEAFNLISDDKYELWLCGSGSAESIIKKYVQKDRRIKFYGYVSKETIQELQTSITLYINPRQNIGQYTKYSFPSKTLEYMASGKPVLMYRLDGIPEEYDQYLFYVEDNTVECLKKRIIEICSMSPEYLEKFGMAAKRYVYKEKNYVDQTKKILKLILRE